MTLALSPFTLRQNPSWYSEFGNLIAMQRFGVCRRNRYCGAELDREIGACYSGRLCYR